MSKKVIFLDIDGVLQPPGKQDRFRHDLEALREDLAVRFDDPEYLEMDRYDLGAVYYDWDTAAVERLRNLCTQADAEIVISSDWRTYSPLTRLKDYFRLHDLDQYVTGEIPELSGQQRPGEVADYLKNDPDIQRFVILDDSYSDGFEERYPQHFVYCHRIFNDDDYARALRILTESES